MEKFKKTVRGYDPEEVNRFLDKVIKQVEEMVLEIKEKDAKLFKMESMIKDYQHLKDKLEQYERMESTLNKAILMAQKTSDQIKNTAHHESEAVINEAKRNASRIVNDALMRAEKTELEANMLERNVRIFKRRLKDIIETQLEVVEEIEKIEL